MTPIEIFKQKFDKMVDNIPASVDNGAGYVIDEVYKILDLLKDTKIHEGLEEAAEEHSGLNFDRQMEYKSFWNDVDTFKAGAKWQKDKMMEDAVEGKVFMSFAPGHNQVVMADVDLPTNTKVKLIIIKEDQK